MIKKSFLYQHFLILQGEDPDNLSQDDVRNQQDVKESVKEKKRRRKKKMKKMVK
jgi:hypothetical protein